MLNQNTMKSYRLRSLEVRVLGALHTWSGRRYRRELLREALWRISREMAAKREGLGRNGQARSEHRQAVFDGHAKEAGRD
jgi:hypothetical protein